MKRQLLVLTLFVSAFSHAAVSLVDFKYELSCSVINHNSTDTIMIHSTIEYDAKSNTCISTQGNYFEGAKDAYEIAFKCVQPVPVTLTNDRLIQAWLLKAPLEGPTHRINELALMLDHTTQMANGFATAPNGTVYSITCKKW